MKINSIVFLIIITFSVYSCEKIQSYPPEPEISLNDIKVENTKDVLGNKVSRITVKIDFVDGDGDLISENVSDTNIYSKLHTINYKKINGNYFIVPATDTSYYIPSMRLPYEDFMQRNGQNKTFKGTITRFITFYSVPFDTIKLSFYLYDRAYHKSNTLNTSDISLIK